MNTNFAQCSCFISYSYCLEYVNLSDWKGGCRGGGGRESVSVTENPPSIRTWAMPIFSLFQTISSLKYLVGGLKQTSQSDTR